MKCNECDTEMLIDSIEQTPNTEIFNYKCPNGQCPNYGYGGSQNE